MTTAQLLPVLKAQHTAIDTLMAMIIMLDERFKPTRSGQPWEALVAGNYAIELLEADARGEPYFACPICRAVSFNQSDVEFGYCGKCHQFTRGEVKP